MSLETKDSGLNQALETVLEHPSPFRVDELQALKGPLKISSAADISLLCHCQNLEQLEIHASNINNLSDITGLDNLTTLRVTCSPIEDITAITTCTNLEIIEIMFTLVEDLTPLMALPSLRRGVLIGNPWNETSYNELRPRLLESPSRRWQQPPMIEFSNKWDWELTCQLRARGQRGCFGVHEGHSVLVRPGIPSIPNLDCDFMYIDPGILRPEMHSPDFSVDGLFTAVYGESVPTESESLFAVKKHYTQGNAEEAKAWVNASKLPKTTKQALLRFIKRFPTLQFYKEDTELLNSVEVSEQVKLPKWLRDIRQTLAYVMYGKLVWVRFDQFDGWSPRSEQLDQIWYSLGLRGYNNDEQRDLISQDGLFPVGEWLETGRSTLAIKLDTPKDQRVYEYTEEDIWDNQYDGRPLFESVNIAFNSYAEMLGHIVAFQLQNREVIEAIE
ncbi:hypothetical protein [uncultured Nostoc sp.]|uniref:hypothetical protein n=1 Tax=uncultured Nostoc sp. TaxID=340711 RepID=UPI0035CB5D03